jgi:hypothetical protein
MHPLRLSKMCLVVHMYTVWLYTRLQYGSIYPKHNNGDTIPASKKNVFIYSIYTN